jgi:hypothetical protein
MTTTTAKTPTATINNQRRDSLLEFNY